MTLGKKQELFSRLIVRLLQYIYKQGYEVRFAQFYRTPIEAKRLGFENSNHTRRLAADLLLFKNGKWLTKSKKYEFAGEYWEKLGPWHGVETVWGGRWKSRDGVHFSIRHGKVG